MSECGLTLEEIPKAARVKEREIDRLVTSGIKAKMAKGALEPWSNISSQTDKVEGNDRGRIIEKQGAKAKKDNASSSSRNKIGDLETCMSKGEITLGDVHGTVEDISTRIEGGESRMRKLEAEVLELKSSLGELRGEMLGSLADTTKEH